MERHAVEKLFSERKDFIIIGLTGRTGSGCTYVSKYLSQSFEDLQPPKADSVSKKDMDCENRQYQIVYDYAKENWIYYIYKCSCTIRNRFMSLK